MKENTAIVDYVLITPSGERREIGSTLPEDLDTLGVGELLTFPSGTDAATKDRFVGYLSRRFWSKKRFKAAGIQLHSLQSGSRRSVAVDCFAGLSASASSNAIMAVIAFVTLGAFLSMSSISTTSAETIRAFDKSFLVFATQTYKDDAEKLLKDIEKAKIDLQRFKKWEKEAGHAE